MAAVVGDCFSIGSIVACKNCFDQTVEGEVLAFDQESKMLILKCRSKTAVKLNDVYITNLQFCSDVQVKKEVNSVIDPPQPLNLHRLRTRIRNNIEQRQIWVTSRNAGVSTEGQNLYMAVTKTLGQQRVVWQGANIVIFNEVAIAPPYRVDNVTGIGDNVTGIGDNETLLIFVKKIVNQFMKTQESAAPVSSASSNSPASSTSTTNAKASAVGTSSNASASPVPAN